MSLNADYHKLTGLVGYNIETLLTEHPELADKMKWYIPKGKYTGKQSVAALIESVNDEIEDIINPVSDDSFTFENGESILFEDSNEINI